MKFALKHIQFKSLLLLISTILFAYGCSPDKPGDLGMAPTASFTMAPIAGAINTFVVQSTSTNAFGYQWDKGDGNFTKGNAIDTIYFPLRGNYTVKLRAFGRGGYDSTGQSVSVTVDDIENIPNFKMLVAKSWKLDPAPGAIIVGTEANPAAYFGGGSLDGCQLDDVYTFRVSSTGLKLNYNANGSTFNAGNIAPNYTCAADRSYTDETFTFDPRVPAGAAGVATITLPGAVPSRFIGVTDVSSNNYRIISISANAMVLRSGTPTQTVHQFKFVAQ